MPSTAMLPPSGDRDIRCHTRVDQIHARYSHLLKRYHAEEINDNLRRDLMMNVCLEVLGNAETTMETVDYMMEVDAFWRKPVHVQTLETQLAMARADLAKRTDFLAWLTVHLSSSKFRGEGNNFINTDDIIHAMREHGVYGG